MARYDNPNAPAPSPDDPYANKSVVSALGGVVLVLLRWAVSGEFQLEDEGLITLAVSITTLAVYTISNFRRFIGLKDEKGQTSSELLRVLLFIVVLIIVVILVLKLIAAI